MGEYIGSLITGLCTLAGTLSGSYLTYYLERKKCSEMNFQEKKLECYTLINKIPFLLIPRYLRCKHVLIEGRDLAIPEEDPIESFSKIELIILDKFNLLFDRFQVCKSQVADFNAFLMENIVKPHTTQEHLEDEFTKFMVEISRSIAILNQDIINTNISPKDAKPNFWVLKNKITKNVSDFFSTPKKNNNT